MTAASSSSPGSAFGGARRLAPDAPCPCGAGRFGTCCGPLLAGRRCASSAEELMRSRYTAFALGDGAYLHETWHPSTRPERVDPGGHLVWLSLAIDETVDGRSGDRRGVVAFRARWRDGRTGERGVLQERSRFVFQRERWWYLAGDVAM